MHITINIPDQEHFNNQTQEFVYIKGGTFRFEHSLYTIAKWEAINKTAYLNHKLTEAESKSYLQCMCLDAGFSELLLTNEVVSELTNYMNDKHTATTVQNDDKPSRRIITSEVIYSMMVAGNVPFETERWHIDRLLILLAVIGENNNPDKKKQSKADTMAQNRELNRQRQAKYKTKG